MEYRPIGIILIDNIFNSLSDNVADDMVEDNPLVGEKDNIIVIEDQVENDVDNFDVQAIREPISNHMEFNAPFTVVISNNKKQKVKIQTRDIPCSKIGLHDVVGPPINIVVVKKRKKSVGFDFVGGDASPDGWK